MAERQRAGLVEEHDVEAAEFLQNLRVADEHAHLGRAADAGDDGERSRQAERAGAGRAASTETKQVSASRSRGSGPQRSHAAAVSRANAIAAGTNQAAILSTERWILGFVAWLSRTDSTSARQRGLLARTRHADLERAVLVQRAAPHSRARRLLHGQALAGEQGLVHGGAPGRHLAVGADLLPGPDAHDLADDDFAQRDRRLPRRRAARARSWAPGA